MDRSTVAIFTSCGVIVFFAVTYAWPIWLVVAMFIAMIFIAAIWDVATMEWPPDE